MSKRDEQIRKQLCLVHLACAELAKRLYSHMNRKDKNIVDDHMNEEKDRIQVFDKYSIILNDDEKKIYDENKQRVAFRIKWGHNK
jgi:hypothetical protein